jgi:hypothetical protein
VPITQLPKAIFCAYNILLITPLFACNKNYSLTKKNYLLAKKISRFNKKNYLLACKKNYSLTKKNYLLACKKYLALTRKIICLLAKNLFACKKNYLLAKKFIYKSYQKKFFVNKHIVAPMFF